MNLIKIIIVFLYSICVNFSFGQGCSDAGFCTINSFKPNKTDSTFFLKNQFKLGIFYGNADNSISIYGSFLEYNRIFNKKIGFDLKLTSLAHNGNGISNFSLSDVFVNLNYKVIENLKFTFGTKIPLSKANSTFENFNLPMDYQSSLGTFDIILGLGYEYNNILFIAAFQHPLSQNDNNFFSTDTPFLNKNYQSTNKFERSSDFLLRVAYPININSKLIFTPSILPIYHLTNDKYTDKLNYKNLILGSKGLTINGNVYLDYKINSKNSIQLNVGAPFLTRDARPDGLTRSFITNFEYNFKF